MCESGVRSLVYNLLLLICPYVTTSASVKQAMARLMKAIGEYFEVDYSTVSGIIKHNKSKA